MQTPNIEPWLAWERLCRELGVSEEYTKQGFGLLASRYGESHRRYHTLAHIKDCLEQFELLRDACEHPFAVELAIWFHDVVYQPLRFDNEEESAKQLVTFATSAGVDRETIEIAHACVLVTKHQAMPATRDQEVILDVDLSILGRDWEVYEQYTKQIRQEYKAVMKLIYVVRRKAIMEKFLRRGRIYATECFYRRYELRARTNIQREIS